VQVYAVLAWIGAFIAAITGLGIILGGSLLGGIGFMVGPEARVIGGLLAVLGIAFGILLIFMAVFDLFVGIGLWGRKPWARIATLIFSALSLVSFPVGTLIGALGIWLFGFEPTVKGLFVGLPPK
jgi:hypothetical protein